PPCSPPSSTSCSPPASGPTAAAPTCSTAPPPSTPSTRPPTPATWPSAPSSPSSGPSSSSGSACPPGTSRTSSTSPPARPCGNAWPPSSAPGPATSGAPSSKAPTPASPRSSPSSKPPPPPPPRPAPPSSRSPASPSQPQPPASAAPPAPTPAPRPPPATTSWRPGASPRTGSPTSARPAPSSRATRGGRGDLAFPEPERYAQGMSDASHAYELPEDETVPADAVREAAGGEVVYLTRNGTPVAAVVSADAAEYLQALEDAADTIAARRALAEQALSVPPAQVWRELGVAALGWPPGRSTPSSGPRPYGTCANSQRTRRDGCGPPPSRCASSLARQVRGSW